MYLAGFYGLAGVIAAVPFEVVLARGTGGAGRPTSKISLPSAMARIRSPLYQAFISFRYFFFSIQSAITFTGKWSASSTQTAR